MSVGEVCVCMMCEMIWVCFDCFDMSVRLGVWDECGRDELCEEEATEEKEEEAAGTELKTKTPHSAVGNKTVYFNLFQIFTWFA